jgi:hypothetical protein
VRKAKPRGWFAALMRVHEASWRNTGTRYTAR